MIEWIAEACQLYGWTVEYVLAMEVKRFFAMLNAGRKIRAGRNQDLCDIAAIAIGNAKYYQDLRSSYTKSFVTEQEISELPMQISDDQARDAVVSFFGGGKRGRR